MSTYAIPAGLDIERLRRLVIAYLREPSGIVYGNGLGAPPTLAEFTPDLTAAEAALLSDLVSLCKSPLDWSPCDYGVFKAERPTLAAYIANANPKAAEGAAAIKSIIRVLNAIVRTG